MIMRPVHVHEPFAQFGQRVQGRGRAIHELPVRSRRSERTLEHKLASVAWFEAVLIEKVFQRRPEPGDIEDGFNGAGIAATPDKRTVGALTEDEIERAKDRK